jgi:phosphoribosylanthranilate isomerase
MSALVKICGITREDTIIHLARLPVDYAGFVFAPSKRQVTPAQAASLASAFAQAKPIVQTQLVGVFVNPTLQELEETLREVPLDIIQLHGSETPEFSHKVKDEFGVKVFKALPVPEHTDETGAALAMPDEYVSVADAILLDTYDPQAAGGTGRTFRWSVIPAYRAWAERAGIKLLVAGGLTADNVGELIAEYRPHGVDVSSGVETNGMKDVDKMTAFVERVKQHV